MIRLLNNDAIEVITVKDKYRVVEVDTPDGIQEDYELIAKDLKSRKCIRIIDITEVSQLVSDFGFPISNRTQLDLRMKEPIIVMGKYRDFKELVFGKTDYSTKIGFK